MNKIQTLEKIQSIIKMLKKQGKKIGFITGCFDILHEGHIDLFRFAKKNVDILIIALDSDEAIKEGKGGDRPIHSQKQRAKVLSELESVDLIIPITEKYSFLNKESVESVHDKIRTQVQADYIITSPQADNYWQSKKDRAQKSGIKMLLFDELKPISSSSIISKIQKEL